MLKTIFINSTKCLRFNDERALNDAVGVSQGLATAYCQLSPSETHRAKHDMQFSKHKALCFHNYFSLLLLQVNWGLSFVGLTSNLFFMMVEMLSGLNIILKIILVNRNNSDTMHYKVITSLSPYPGMWTLHSISLSKISLSLLLVKEAV